MGKTSFYSIKAYFYALFIFLFLFFGVSLAEESYDPEKILQIPHQSILSNETLPQTGSNSGALIHRIPIKVAPGRGGFQPEIALVYNSQDQQNSWVGVGWRLDLGSIGRSSKKRINFDNTDAFSYDGIDLVSRNGSWGAGWYGAKIEKEFIKYKFNGDSLGWEMYSPDGRISCFGTSSESQIKSADNDTVRWLLDSITDPNGNSISVEYDNSGDEIYLSQISYQPSGSRIEFILENRPDVTPVYKDFTRIELSRGCSKFCVSKQKLI